MNGLLKITSLLGNTDIYLLDQIMKGRYSPSALVLDAGAGAGRNLHWFVQAGCKVFGTDRDSVAVEALKQNYPGVPADCFQLAPVETLPFQDVFFHHIICSAVLHFAENESHFEKMFAELVRVLRPGGSIFIRVATDVGMADRIIPLGNGRFQLPDGSDRFLMTRQMLDTLLHQHRLQFLEPFKTVLVENMRSMGVLVLGKL